MSRGAGESLGIGALVACLAGCTSEGPLVEIGEIRSLGDLAAEFEGAAPLLAKARPLGEQEAGDLFRVRHLPTEPPLDSRWQSTARELQVTLSADDAASFEVAAPDTPWRVGVSRSTPLSAQASRMERALRVRAPGGDAEASAARAPLLVNVHDRPLVLVVRIHPVPPLGHLGLRPEEHPVRIHRRHVDAPVGARGAEHVVPVGSV